MAPQFHFAFIKNIQWNIRAMEHEWHEPTPQKINQFSNHSCYF